MRTAMNEFKLPYNFLQKLKALYPERFEAVEKTFLEKKHTTFRVNCLKTDLGSLRQMLRHNYISFSELDYPEGTFLLKTSLRQFQNSDIYRRGLVSIQNVSSMLPVIALAPASGEAILDLCAAPGIKTAHLASCATEAEIVAIEKVRKRYYKLQAYLSYQGANNVKTLLLDSSWVRKKYPDYFDKILADVPCSAEARFLVSNPLTYKYWSEYKVREMEHKQRKLLHAAFFALKEGGTLLYSTCAFSPEENECVINWFLNRFKDKVELLPLDYPCQNAVDGLKRWKDEEFCADMQYTKRIIPDAVFEGFFIAKIKKLSD